MKASANIIAVVQDLRKAIRRKQIFGCTEKYSPFQCRAIALFAFEVPGNIPCADLAFSSCVRHGGSIGVLELMHKRQVP